MNVQVTRSPVAPSRHDEAAPKPFREIADLPGPKGLPLIGNMHQIDRPRIHLVLEKWAAEFGPLYRFRMGRESVAAVSDPKLCEQILRDRPRGFSRSSRLGRVFAELGVDGVFSAEGEAWRRQRQLAVHALAQRNLRQQYRHLTTVAARLKARWDRLAVTGETLDLNEEFKRFTVDATTLVAFDYDINTIEQDGDVIQRKLELIFPTFQRRLFAMVPLWRFVRSPKDRKFDRALADVRLWLGGLVAAARARLAEDPARGESPSNFLESMLVARDDNGEPFSDDVLFANLMTMLVAGEDTTAYSLAWAVHHLCDSPDSVEALRAEADEVLGTAVLGAAVLRATDYPPDVDKANKLAWAGAVSDETMRLRSVAPIMFVTALADTVVGDLRLPKGAQAVVLGRAGAIDAAHFDDPSAFRPRRWLGGASGTHDARASIPFGSGPRICPGRSLALLEMKLMLSMLYKNFDVERVGAAADVHEVFSFTMMPGALKVRLRRRDDWPEPHVGAV